MQIKLRYLWAGLVTVLSITIYSFLVREGELQLGSHKFILNEEYIETEGFGLADIYVTILSWGVDESRLDQNPEQQILADIDESKVFEGLGLELGKDSRDDLVGRIRVILSEPSKKYVVWDDDLIKSSERIYQATKNSIKGCPKQSRQIAKNIYLYPAQQYFEGNLSSPGSYGPCEDLIYILNKPIEEISNYQELYKSSLGRCVPSVINRCVLNFRSQDIEVRGFDIELRYLKYYYELEKILFTKAIVKIS